MQEVVEPQSGSLSVFIPFDRMEKQSDGTLRVFAEINDETVDDQGEIVDYDGAKVALDEFMKFANVREMHQPSAVGVAEGITHDDVLRKSVGILHIVDAEAVKKVEAKVYKGTSLGGWKRDRVTEMHKASGKPVIRVRKPIVNEISLVDRPSRATALLSMMKVSEITEPPVEADPEPLVLSDVPAPADGEPLVKSTGEDATPGAETPASAPAAGDGEPAAGDVYTDKTGAVVPETPMAKAEAAPAPEPEPVVVAPAEPVVPADEPIEKAAQPAEADPAVTLTPLEPSIDMAYALVVGDLAKRAAAGEALPPLAKTIATFLPSSAPMEKLASAPTLDYNAVAQAVIDKFGDTLPQRETIAAVQSSITEINVKLEKIAKQPVPGGPLRYAMDDRRFNDLAGLMDRSGDGPDTADLLAKAAAQATDPIVREALGRAAAARQISDMQQR